MSDTVHIATLRLRSPRADAAALVSSVARELSGAELHPPGLLPRELLVVRRLADPRPGSFAVDRLAFRPPVAWERAVRESLAELVRRAARPDSRGRLPDGAEAVIFADRTELLACRLVADAEPWWWRRLPASLRGSAKAMSLATRLEPWLGERIRELPGIVARLADWGEAGRLTVLSPDGAIRLLAAVVREHRLARALAGPAGAGNDGTSGGRDGGRDDRWADLKNGDRGADRNGGRAVGRDAGPVAALPVRTNAAEPWWSALPSALALPWVAAEVRALAGVALGLARTPGTLRAKAFVDAAERWWRMQTASPNPATPSPPVPTRSALLKTTSTPVAEDPARSPEGVAPAREVAPMSRQVPPTSPPPISPPASAASPPASPHEVPPNSHKMPRDARQVPTVSCEVPPTSSYTPEVPPVPREVPGTSPKVPPTSQEVPGTSPTSPHEVPSVSPEPVVTAWGGVLFLIHLLDAFDLPPGDPWGLLELVARGLLEHRPEGSPPEIEDDGIWSVLAELRGVDNPPSPAARTAIEARLPALRKRLLLALGRTGEADPVDGDPVDGDPVDGDPVERLLRLDARIRLTPTHVDLVTGLDEIWLPARRAGLDRDPGWRPDYSRIIHFHFL